MLLSVCPPAPRACVDPDRRGDGLPPPSWSGPILQMHTPVAN